MIQGICSNPACGRLVPQAEMVRGRCPACSRSGSTRSWRRLRVWVIERAGGCCTRPGCEVREGLEVHHVDGDVRNNVEANLAVLCHQHHLEAEGRMVRR